MELAVVFCDVTLYRRRADRPSGLFVRVWRLEALVAHLVLYTGDIPCSLCGTTALSIHAVAAAKQMVGCGGRGLSIGDSDGMHAEVQSHGKYSFSRFSSLSLGSSQTEVRPFPSILLVY